MSKMWQVLVVLLCVAFSSYGIAQDKDKDKDRDKKDRKEAAKEADKEVEISEVLTGSITHLRRIILPVAIAMPEDKYGFAPSNGEFKGVRTFSQQLKHLSTTNFIYAAAILGEKPPVEAGEAENGPESVKSKDEIHKYLLDSFEYVLKAVDTINEKNVTAPIKNPFGMGTTTRLAMAVLIVGHCNDHYGQMVEYLRMNGIVPPASAQ
jgi:uncharacterized damage-inducible protein DinB